EPEADPQIGEDEELADDDEDRRAPDEVRPDDRTDGAHHARLTRPELIDELLMERGERRPLGHLSRARRGARARRTAPRRRGCRRSRRRGAGGWRWAARRSSAG